MLLDESGVAAENERQHQQDEERVVERRRRDEVERHGQIEGEADEKCLPPPGDARVAQEPEGEEEEVRDEPGERTGLLAAVREMKVDGERDGSCDERASGDEEPEPDAHRPSIASPERPPVATRVLA